MNNYETLKIAGNSMISNHVSLSTILTKISEMRIIASVKSVMFTVPEQVWVIFRFRHVTKVIIKST